MNKPWSKNPIISQRLLLLWDKGVLTESIASYLNKEFRLRLTGSAVRAQVRRFGFKQRSVRGANKKPKSLVPASKPEEPVRSTPSMPPIPKSAFFEPSITRTSEYLETH